MSNPDCLFCKIRDGRRGEKFTDPLCNFEAEIVADVERDDGVEVRRQFAIVGRLEDGRALPPIQVDAAKFPAMGWVSGGWSGVDNVRMEGPVTRGVTGSFWRVL